MRTHNAHTRFSKRRRPQSLPDRHHIVEATQPRLRSHRSKQVAMPVMQVGKMGVTVDHRRVPVPVGVRLPRRDILRMFMLVMDVMDVAVVVHERLMYMLVAVGFG